MSTAEAIEFENWLLKVYQTNNSIPFHILAQILKDIRANAGR